MSAEDLLDAAFPGDDKPAGELRMQVSDQHANLSDHFPQNLSVVLCEQRLDGKLIAAWMPVTTELVDAGLGLGRVVAGAFDRVLRPWRFPDANPMPVLRPFRTVALVTDALGWVHRRLAR